MALQEFRNSWTDADSYPLNLALLGSNNGFLEARKQLLAAIAAELFNDDSTVVLLELGRDSLPTAAGAVKTLSTDAHFANALALPRIGAQVTASKVGCRFIFIQAENSQARLDARLEHVRQILTYFQVMPSFVDFMSVFAVREGEQYEASDLRFSGFRDKLNLSPHMSRLEVGFLGLGGYHYQLCYNLKCIANKTQEDGRRLKLARDKWRWSPRQLVFHHQFDMELGTTLWILVAARDDLQKRVEKLVGPTGRAEDRNFSSPESSFQASLVVHLLLAQAASEDWRGHLRWLEQVLEEKTQKALKSATYNPDISDLLYVQAKEDEASKAIMMLNANAEVLGSLKQFYKGLLEHSDFGLGSRESVKRTVNDFLAQLDEFIHDFQMHSSRAGTLVKMTADRKNLVQQRLQAKASDRVEKLTTEAQREAIIMRIIAVVTGIFLPATFVSTFFSTDVVKYQGTDGKESFSSLALERWFEVTIVLTMITFALALGWIFWRDMKAWLLSWRRKKVKDMEKAL